MIPSHRLAVVATPPLRRVSSLCQRANTYVTERRSYLRRSDSKASGASRGLRAGAWAASAYRAVAKHIVGRGPRTPAWGETSAPATWAIAQAYDGFKEGGLAGTGLRLLGESMGCGERHAPTGSQPADDIAATTRFLLLTVPEAALILTGGLAHCAWRVGRSLAGATFCVVGASVRGVRLIRGVPEAEEGA